MSDRRKKDDGKEHKTGVKSSRIKELFPLSFIIAFVFDLIYGFFYYRQFNAISLYDTASYFTAADNILKGHPDLLRTPVYPLFLHICNKITSEHVNELSVGIQIVVFYISIFIFFRLISLFTSNHVIRAAGTIFYGCMSPVAGFNFLMLTESFSVSGMVLFAYLLVLFLREWKIRHYTCCIILSLILTLLRPSSVFLFVVVFIAGIIWLVRIISTKQKAKRNIIPPVCFALCLAVLFGYMEMNRLYNGFFGLSYVSEMNKFYDVVQADIWQGATDPDICYTIQSKLDDGESPLAAAIDTASLYMDSPIEREQIIRFSKEAISSNRPQYAYYLAKKIFTMGYNNMEYNLSNDSYFLKDDANKKLLWPGDLMDFNINFVYFVVLLSFIGITAAAIKKKFLKSELIITLIIAGQLAVNILAGPAEFHRLNVPCYPFALLIVIIWAGLAFDRIISSKSGSEKEEATQK